MKPTKDDIRRRLGLREVPTPPEDLARRIKAEIPASFRYPDQVSVGSKGRGATSASWGMSWQVAASFLVLTLVGVGIYMVTFESEKSAVPASSIAERDGATEMEFAPPTTPSSIAAAPAPEAQESRSKQNAADSAAKLDSPAAPPPPAARIQAMERNDIEGGVTGGVEGGVVGGVLGGMAAAPASDDSDPYLADKPAEAAAASARDKKYAEEKESLAAAGAAPAPVAIAEAPGRRDAKGEQARGSAVAQPTMQSAAAPAKPQDLGKDKAASSLPLRVGGDVKAPVIIKRVEIVYPEAARNAQIQGIQIVEAVIDRHGDVKEVRILKALPMGLDEAAIAAVKQWKFKPGTLDGKPVDVIFNLTVNAKLAR